MISRLRKSWNQPDQYDWLTAFLRQRGLLPSARVAMALVTGSSVLVPATILPSEARPSTIEVITGAVAGTFTLGLTLLLLLRWPTRRQSQTGVMVGTVLIGGWSLVQPTGPLAALASTGMAIPASYIAFFHSARILLFNIALAIAVVTAAVLRLAHETNPATAACAVWMNGLLNLALPVGIWAMSRAMATYVRRSQEDALTGLLNRPALTDAVGNALADPPTAHTHLEVVMVDLDNFKSINDTHGHSAGDDALRAVAELLREHSPAGAMICRAGGEEFLIALTCKFSHVRQLAGHFCTALGALSPRITASVGTASAELRLLRGPDVAQRVDELIRMADAAMYTAKRRGGNQAQHCVRS